MNSGSNYFNLDDYLKNLEINSFVLEHLAEFQYKFDKYLQKLLSISSSFSTYFSRSYPK